MRANHPAAYVARCGLEFRVAERAGEVTGRVHWRDDFIRALHVHRHNARSVAFTAILALKSPGSDAPAASRRTFVISLMKCGRVERVSVFLAPLLFTVRNAGFHGVGWTGYKAHTHVG
jgi:hypothetical protein